MRLEENHKEFVVRHFASFMKLTDIVEAFIEEFEDELPTLDLPEIPDMDELKPLTDQDLDDKLYFLNEVLEQYTKEFEEKYGDEADKKLNERAIDEFEFDRKMTYVQHRNELQTKAHDTQDDHQKQLRKNLFNQFRRLNIEHPQFPNKYRTLFNQARKDYFSAYRSESLQNPDNILLELETLYLCETTYLQ